ncbi:hypothetical protein BX616_006921 [Lobosporangium transversale]|uniref:Uncharacterized protein n=1 Tax=Lobosporangium transversale TaxID=64571 RepID=A0A1Y2GL52_9FUNG|nr:hypothetical protein BCR41DRAFT_423045 [Lobosporangium transversale]KAF9915094.1 hypothetical protein BX616_006921 [Lobosporangium transversale]ORZ12976.1 hypothetical protein BCR41DRAFT_423045 [Lobosporangium transversale]|eukprot:XP_021880325.1 hypothetical protein BCR41DRAFT_423045 [Lobosporangium transversale]
MASINHLGNESQAFRARFTSQKGALPPVPSSSSEIRVIPTRVDTKSGQRIILWNDICSEFPNASRIVNKEGQSILFLTDENFEYYNPKRISAQPGEVLEVVVPDAGIETNSSVSEGLVSDVTHPQGLKKEEEVDMLEIKDLPISESTATLDTKFLLAEAGITELQLIPSSSALAATTEGLNVDLVMESQKLHAENVKKALRYYFDKLQAQAEENRRLHEQQLVLQEEINQTQRRIDEENRQWHQKMVDQQREMQKSFDEKQNLMIQMQEQALERLVIIQDRVQAVLTQTYELHEYPIPHLFIVLPKVVRARDSYSKPFSNQFRLFFLCECGKHTMTENSTIPHEIHLAKHEGYDIDRPTDFFDKYGPYVLTMMQMVKFGFAAAGVVVPALNNTGLIEGMDAVKSGLDFAQKSFGSLVDDTINFINDQTSNANGGMDAAADSNDHLKLDKLEVLEGADLRQLESYLKVQDSGRVLGNLYRIVTQEGKVKWVCIDHYRENYKTSTIKNLKDAVTANRGEFPKGEGKVVITFSSSSMAKQFYDVLVKARGVQTLDITLGWDVTMDDLRKLANTATTSNILHLKLNGKHFKGPNRDIINNSRRFDPILQLLQNQRIQALELYEFRDLYDHISTASLGKAPQMRTLVLGSNFNPLDEESKSILTRILQACSGLAKLTVWTTDFRVTALYLTDKLGYVLNLDTLTVVDNALSFSMDIKIFQGTVRGAVLTTSAELTPICPHIEQFIGLGHLTHIFAKQVTEDIEENAWMEILTHSPKLSEIQIECNSSYSFGFINLISSIRPKVFSSGGYCSLHILRLQEDGVPFITLEFSVEAAAAVYTVDLNTSKFPRTAPLNRLKELLRKQGSLLEQLTLDAEFTDEHATTLDMVTKDEGSKLRSLRLRPDSLTSVGWECIDRIISRSPELVRLGVDLFDIDNKEKLALAEQFLTKHASRLTRLSLDGSLAEEWVPRFSKVIPTRLSLPHLDTFEINCHEKLDTSPQIAEWITAMVLGPGRKLPSSDSPNKQNELSSNAAQQEDKDDDNEKETTTGLELIKSESEEGKALNMWTPLDFIRLEEIQLSTRTWQTLIEAIDYAALDELSVRETNFDLGQLYVLANCLPEDSKKPAPLRLLQIGNTRLDGDGTRDLDLPKELTSALRRRAPLAKIEK